ncbi:response regulator transcription factor [Budviciaceae bacterium CWB-B4]|uniref:Response regulator transcription factor n=1 Tax=Limnobaculum xujianqingii TaxID=2738837 RepID=A0A9D7AFD0_9GAMM|nr:response regulator transcription factor [Limnobaculum xujianqingii]MBK5071722.1 response regulator transcription factor [Limnobaculum xujianqingii]MBK5175031.1 response regulator transcription factor [Limnobaculum xujianqingii]
MESVTPMVKKGIVMHSCPLVRHGLLHFLNTCVPEITFQTVESFSAMARTPGLAEADLVVSDIRDEEKDAINGVNWLLWLQSIRSDRPMLVITDLLSDEQIIQLCKQPLISMLALQTPETQLRQQIEIVLSGELIISPQLYMSSTVAGIDLAVEPLTDAEQRVLKLMYQGYSIVQIAEQLCRSAKTISTHKYHLMRKLRVRNEVELFARVGALH